MLTPFIENKKLSFEEGVAMGEQRGKQLGIHQERQ